MAKSRMLPASSSKPPRVAFQLSAGPCWTWTVATPCSRPLIARRLAQAQAANTQAVNNNIQLDVALAYLDLLRTYGQLAVNA